MQRVLKILLAVLFASIAFVVQADNCAICGQPIVGKFYFMTDKVTGERVEVCSNCAQLPRCFICGLPVKDGVQLPDGRWLCARDAKTAVLDTNDVVRIFYNVHDDLDKLFSRYTSFPTNVDAFAIDQIDVDSTIGNGNAVENSDLLGYTQGVVEDGRKRYKIGLLTGQSEVQMEEVCAHELSHAWVGENVPPERHARIERDTEEGFCEMMGYLLMDSKGEEGEKKRVLANGYTRGQVQLFIAAEQEYGFDEILNWMEYGVEGRLEEGHLDEIRDVKMPTSNFPAMYAARPAIAARAEATPVTLKLQGIMWGSAPSAIINGRSFFAGDEFEVPLGRGKTKIQCLNIEKNSVRIRNVDTGNEQKLELPTK
jgi:hypothetical protein